MPTGASPPVLQAVLRGGGAEHGRPPVAPPDSGRPCWRQGRPRAPLNWGSASARRRRVGWGRRAESVSAAGTPGCHNRLEGAAVAAAPTASPAFWRPPMA
eukprot:177329-Chlamydomonas_euryale.AAC.3